MAAQAMQNNTADHKREQRRLELRWLTAKTFAQAGIVIKEHRPTHIETGAAWRREAARLFREFWRSGNQKHLCAFVKHVQGMRAHCAGLPESLQKLP